MSPTKAATKATKIAPTNPTQAANRRLVLKPRMSEKAYALAQELNTYVFDVPMTSNKASIAAAVIAQFSVEVVNIKIILVKGKPKKSYQKRNRPTAGKRADYKKAYVRLKSGDSIDIFGEVEESKSGKKSANKETK